MTKTIIEQAIENVRKRELRPQLGPPNKEYDIARAKQLRDLYIQEAMRMFAVRAQREIHKLLFDKEWHKHHKEALSKCITIIEELKKQEAGVK